MYKRISVGGSAAKPPTNGHVELGRCLRQCGRFDLVIWIPSGSRNDKHMDIDPDDRVAMTMLAFPPDWLLSNSPSFVIKFDDVYGRNTPTINRMESLQAQYPDAEIVWYTGADSVIPGTDGLCDIQRWARGSELWSRHKFLIVSRQGYQNPAELILPPQFEVLDVELPDTSSTEVVDLIKAGQKFEHLVPPAVAAYIKARQLYGYQPQKQ